MERLHARHAHPSTTLFLQRTHGLAQRFGRVERSDILSPSLQKVVCESAAEALLRLRTKVQSARARRSTHIFLPALQDGVQALAVGSRHVLHVGHVFQPSLYLQRGNSCVEQLLQHVQAVHVLQRQQVLVLHHHPSVGIHQRERQAAELGTLPTVGTAPEASLAGVTLSAITYTQSPVHKHLERRVGTGLVDGGYLVKRQFARQYHLSEAGLRQKAHLSGRSVVHLRAGMQRDGWQVQACQAHVLYDKRIHTPAIQFPDHVLRLLQLLVLQDGVHRHVDAHSVEVGIVCQASDVVHRVRSSRPGAKLRRTDIHRVGPVVHRLDATLQIPCRCQQFYFPQYLHSPISLMLYGVS